MLDEQLHGPVGLELVDLDAINRADSRRQRITVSEQDGVERPRRIRRAQPQFQVPAADHALIGNFILVAKHGCEKALPPDTAFQRFGESQVDFRGKQAAVCFYQAFQVGGTDKAAHDFLEGSGKCGDICDSYRQPGGGRVTAKLQNQPGLAFGNKVKRIAQMQSGNGPP